MQWFKTHHPSQRNQFFQHIEKKFPPCITSWNSCTLYSTHRLLLRSFNAFQFQHHSESLPYHNNFFITERNQERWRHNILQKQILYTITLARMQCDSSKAITPHHREESTSHYTPTKLPQSKYCFLKSSNYMSLSYCTCECTSITHRLLNSTHQHLQQQQQESLSSSYSAFKLLVNLPKKIDVTTTLPQVQGGMHGKAQQSTTKYTRGKFW